MPADLISKIAEHGTLGVALGISLWVIWKLFSALQQSNESRLVDQGLFRDKLEAVSTSHLAQSLRMVEACTAAIIAQTHVTEGHKASLSELHETFKEYVDEARQGARRDHTR